MRGGKATGGAGKADGTTSGGKDAFASTGDGSPTAFLAMIAALSAAALAFATKRMRRAA